MTSVHVQASLSPQESNRGNLSHSLPSSSVAPANSRGKVCHISSSSPAASWRALNKNHQPTNNTTNPYTALRKNQVEVSKSSQASSDDAMMDNTDDASQSTDQWELNVSRLVGMTNDGVPPFFSNSEYSFMVNESSKLKVRYSPAPGARRKAYQQKRTGRWRAQQKHQQFKKSVCPPSWKSLKNPSEPESPAGIRKYMKKLVPTTAELQAKVSKDWSKLKKDSKKYRIKTSAKEYVKETQREEK